MEKDRIAKRVDVGEYAGSHSLGKVWKRWIDIMKDCLRNRGLDVRQARRMVVVCVGECMGHIPRDEPQTLTRCHSSELSLLYAACGWKSVCVQTYNLKGIKGKISFLIFVYLLL